MDGQQNPHSRRRVIIAGMAGNILEWYDFSVYGFFAESIGQNFFPSHSRTTSLMEAFAVFAAGFLMRPFGALLFGHLGDRRGREHALTLSVLAMAVPTFLIGLLPSYAEIGVAATVAMVILRLVQGLSVGGEYTTSVVFMVERAPSDRRGMTGAFGVAGAFAGVMLGSAVGWIVAELMPAAALNQWGWRIPFLCGITIGLAGWLLRRELSSGASAPKVAPPPLGAVLREYWGTILQVTAYKALDAVGFYLMFVYATTYLTEIVGLSKGHAMAINTLGMAAALVALPLAGALSDRVGRKPLAFASALAVVLLAHPLYHLLWHPELSVPLVGQIGFAIIIALFQGVAPAAAAEAFPAHVRCVGVAVSHNLCMAILGGTAPMVATYLIARTHNEFAPPLYLMAAAATSAIVVLTMRETARVPLAD
jgi:MHS family proline/betaine transporter-like MFS transporter